jgi:hypothetical protein
MAWGKDPCARVDETIRQVTMGVIQAPARLQQILHCVERILREGDPARSTKRALGEQLSLGYHRQDSAAIQRQRHLVRAIALAELATGVKGAITGTHKTTLKGQSYQQLQTYAQNLPWGTRATPTAIRTVSVNYNDLQFGSGNIIHKFSWGSSSGSLHNLAYVPTREMVRYTRIRVGDVWHDIPLFGKERWDLVDAIVVNPWHPEKTLMPDNPSCPGDIWNGPQGGGTDTHSQANIGPLAGFFLKDPDELVDSEYWAEQEYQYNDTGDHTTWIRDYHKAPGAPVRPDYTVTANHYNDRHWTTFDRGRWLMKRRVFRKSDGQWYFEFTKQGNEDSNRAEVYSTEVRVLDTARRPLVVERSLRTSTASSV